MQALEKILEEVNRLIEKHKNNAFELVEKEPLTQCYTETDIEQTKVHELAVVRDIIRKHMNDGWVPVEERLPEKEKKSYLVTYEAKNGRRYVKEAYLEYVGESPKVAYWTKRNKGRVIAWRPLPEPYRPEGSRE